MGKKKCKSQSQYNKRLESLSLPRNQKSRREEIARLIYNNALKTIREYQSESESYMRSLDYDARRVKRRIQTVISCVDQIHARMDLICPEEADFFTIEEDWIEANLHPMVSYDYVESKADVALGAAIWILDQIRDQGSIPETLDCLLNIMASDESLHMPPIWDPCHSDQMIAGMLYAIRHRNDDCTGLDERKYQKSDWEYLDDRVYMDPYTIENKHRQTVPSRTVFEKMLSLVPEESIKDAISYYEEKWWEWVTRYYKSRAVLVRQEKEIANKLDSLAEKASQRVEQLTTAVNQKRLPVLQKNPLLAKMPSLGSLDINREIPDLSHQTILMQARQWETEMERLEQERTELYHQITSLWVGAGMLPTRCDDAILDEFGMEICDAWVGFEIEDPYKFSFAQLYLIDSGSDLPWMYFPGVSLMMTCASTLPWGLLKFRMEPDGVWMHYDEASDEYVSGSQKAALPKRIKLPTLENWYKLEYLDSREKNSGWQQMYNLSQVLYEITGCIMPRNLERLYPAIPELDRYGIKGKLTLHPIIYCMSLLSEAKHQNRGSLFHPDLKWTEEEPSDAEEIAPDETSESLKKRIAELEAEVKKLKTAAHDAGREVLEEKQRYAKLEADRENDRQELADLRELVFNQNQETYQTDSADESIEFPYHTEQCIVVFGGHDSWAREIRPKLPNVRFIDRTMQPNADLIRKADVIWIQHNALGHMHYYKIINEARRYHIPVRYFSYASAIKCAEQIVRSEDA